MMFAVLNMLQVGAFPSDNGYTFITQGQLHYLQNFVLKQIATKKNGKRCATGLTFNYV
jgi:hypothetical protein